MPEQRKCEVCGRFMETFDTESGSQLQVCEGHEDGHFEFKYLPVRSRDRNNEE